MNIYEITFSPTGGTQKAADLLTQALDGSPIAVDLTDTGTDFSTLSLSPEDVAVIAVPSYAGRVPAPAIHSGKTIGFCQGCLACQSTQRCVIRDDADTIAQTMLTADVVVFAAPV